MPEIWEYCRVSNSPYGDFDIKDKQNITFLELEIVYVSVCVVPFWHCWRGRKSIFKNSSAARV